MKFLRNCLLAGAVLSVAGCSSRPLSQDECGMMLDKLARDSVASAADEKKDEIREKWDTTRADKLKVCAAGKSFDRADYKCVMAAEDHKALGICVVNGVMRQAGLGQ